MERFDIYPARLVVDSAYGSADMLGWLVYEHGIEPACDGVRQVSAPGWYLAASSIPANPISAKSIHSTNTSITRTGLLSR